MGHHDSVLFQKAGKTLEQGLCPVWMSFILALGHLWSFLLPFSCLRVSELNYIQGYMGLNKAGMLETLVHSLLL